MTWVAAIFVVAGFLVLARITGMLRCASGVLARSREAVVLIGNREMDELEKERAVQAHAKALFGSFLLITALSVVALGIPLAIVWLLDWCGLVALDAVMAVLISWQFLVIATGIGLLGWWAMRRMRA